HRLCQRFVRFGRQRTERHAGGIETLQDVFQRFDLLERNRGDVFTQREEVTDGGDRTVVDELRELAILLVVAAAYRILNRAHHIGVDHVVFAAVDELQQTSLLDAL